MRFANYIPAMALLVLGLGLAGGDIWFAAARSTIPLSLDAVVMRRELRPEKHPGLDDVFLLVLDTGRVVQVDEPIYRMAREGEPVEKRRGERVLRHGHLKLPLAWSCDTIGMLKTMPLFALVFALQALIACRRR